MGIEAQRSDSLKRPDPGGSTDGHMTGRQALADGEGVQSAFSEFVEADARVAIHDVPALLSNREQTEVFKRLHVGDKAVTTSSHLAGGDNALIDPLAGSAIHKGAVSDDQADVISTLRFDTKPKTQNSTATSFI